VLLLLVGLLHTVLALLQQAVLKLHALTLPYREMIGPMLGMDLFATITPLTQSVQLRIKALGTLALPSMLTIHQHLLT